MTLNRQKRPFTQNGMGVLYLVDIRVSVRNPLKEMPYLRGRSPVLPVICLRFVLCCLMMTGGFERQHPIAADEDGSALPKLEYELEGSLTIQGSALAGGGHQSKFRVSVAGCQWFIDLQLGALLGPRRPGDLLQPNRLAASSDGDFTYYVRYFGEREQRPDTDTARRSPGIVPYATDREILAVWYAFASHCFFASNAQTRIYPLDPQRIRSKAALDLRTNARTVISPDQSRLPEEIVIGHYFGSTSEKGDIGVRFLVNDWQIAEGLKMPRDVSIDYFLRVAGTEPWITIRLLVERLEENRRRDSFVPNFDRATTVLDARFWTNNPPAEVSLVAETWPEGSVVEANYARLRESLVKKPNAVNHYWAKGVVLIAVIASLLLRLALRKSREQSR